MDKTIKAQLILENGTVFDGRAFGHIKETTGEVVFTTAMTGYQETLTDPSHYGKIVTFAYPLIGNYGINLEDMESEVPVLSGIVVREKCDQPNNWRCEMELAGFLKQHKIMGIEGIDTRALTRLLRDTGTMKGIITTRSDILTESQIKQKFEAYSNKQAVKEVTCKESYVFHYDKKENPYIKTKLDKTIGVGKHVAIIDTGIKRGMLRAFADMGCKVTVFPAFTSADEILKVNPDLVFISNGPGDPTDIPSVIETIKQLIGKKPLFGVCLGHQLIALALGCKTKRLKFGHHGGNQPVKDTETGKVYITSQNHEYNVAELGTDVAVTFTNVNDGTIEGIRHKTLPIYSVQFHPEASAGPLDTQFLFNTFLTIAKEVK